MGTLSLLSFLFTVIPLAVSGPIPGNSCVSVCKTPSNPKLRYVVGQTYTYNFQAFTATSLMGTSADQAVLDVKGQALITIRSPCDLVLQLTKTSVTGLESTVDISELEKRPLPFSWQDGTIESVCPNQDESAWVVNIKKAILSMLQHTAQSLDISENHVIEDDVIGRCPTTYTVESGSVVGSSVKLIKTKNPNQCSKRIGRLSSIPTVPYNVPAELQTTPLMNSTSVCHQQINFGITKQVQCKEIHLLQPFSSHLGGGARTEVTTSLTLSTTSNAANIKFYGEFVRSTLLFNSTGALQQGESDKDISWIVKSICNSLASESPAVVPQLFTELVHAIRKARAKDIKSAYSSIKGKKICPESVKTERIFLDALPQAGSAGSISVMADLLKEGQIPERQAAGWYLSLPLSKFITLDAVKAVVPLVDQAQNSPIGLLGITGLAHRYCIKHTEECKSSADVLQLSSKLGRLLGNKCHVDSKDEVKVLSALKALSNLGVLSPDVRTTLRSCTIDTKLPATIRLAAIEAYGSDSCDREMKLTMRSILSDAEQDSEIRIAAYLVMMRCPCSICVNAVQDILAKEEYNQVGAFIVSHLNNLKSNVSPGKQELRKLVQNWSLNQTFPDDFRKYSQNFGSSEFCNIRNVGWDVDGNVIYSTKSFIPRSVSLNLTLDLFGQSVNLFELGARVENLERILEKYMGPQGSEKLWSDVVSGTRSKRATINKNDVSMFDKAINLKELQSGIKLDGSLRMFGAEVAMVNYRDFGNQNHLGIFDGLRNSITGALGDITQGVKKANVDVARSLMFLDSTAVFPTVAGFPIKVALNGTTTIGLGLETQMDIPALMKDPLNANLKLKLNPTAITEVSAAMTVDISVAKTGIKMVGTIHSSVAADFSAKSQQGNNLEVKLELPKSRATLIDLKSEVLLVQQKLNSAERSKKMAIINEAKYSHGGCSERYAALTGLRFCATSALAIPRPLQDSSKDPTPAFPLSGHGSVSIYMEKTEPNMQSFLLSATLKQDGANAKSLVFTLDTPGSKTNRKVSVKGTVVMAPTLKATVEAQSPWGSYAGEGELIIKPDVKSVHVKISNKKEEYFGKIQMNTAYIGEGVAFSPSLELGWPGQPRNVVWEGRLGYTPGTIQFSSKPTGIWGKFPLSVEGTLNYDFTSHVLKLSLNNLNVVTPMGKTTISTAIAHDDHSYLVSFDLKYGMNNEHSVALNGQFQDLTLRSQQQQHLQQRQQVQSPSPHNRHYKTNFVYKSSRFPQSNIDLKWDSQFNPDLLVSNTLVLVHGPESEEKQNRLYINQYTKMKAKNVEDFSLENKLEVTYPRYSLGFAADQHLKLDSRSVKGGLQVKAGTNNVDGDISLVFVPKDAKTLYELNAKLAYPGKTITLRDVGKKLDAKRFAVSPVLEFKPGHKYELNGQATFLNDQSGTSLSIESDMRMDGKPNVIRMRHNFQIRNDLTFSMDNKVEWDGQQQMSLEGKLFMSAPVPTSEIKAKWKGLFDAKLDARLARNDMKLDMDLSLERLRRRIKINGQSKIQGDSGSGFITAAWDADRDPNQVFGLDISLATPSQQNALEFKSTLNVLNQRYYLSFGHKLGAEFLNGDHNGHLEIELPSYKKIALSFKVSNMNNARRIANRCEINVSIAGDLHQFTFNNVVNDIDRSAMTFNAVCDVILKSPKVDEIKFRVEAKRGVRPEVRNTDIKLLLTAPKWGHTIDATANVEIKKDSLRIVSQYQRGPMVLNLESVVKVLRSGSKSSVDSFIEIKAPRLPWQQVKISSLSTYDLSSISNFEFNEKLTAQYQNSKTISLNFRSKVESMAMDVMVLLETPYQNARRQGVTLTGRLDLMNPRCEGALSIVWSTPDQRQNREIRVDVEMEKRANLLFKVLVTTPKDSGEFRFEGRVLNNGLRYETDIVTGVNDWKTKFSGHIGLNPSQRELDFTLNTPLGNPVRFVGRIGSQSPSYSIEIRVDWGTGTLTVKGNGKYINLENMEGILNINSAEMDIENYELVFSNKLQDKKQKLDVLIKQKGSLVGSAKSSYERKESKSGYEIKGTVEVDMQNKAPISIYTYSFEDKNIDKSDEKGKEYKFKMEDTSKNSLGYKLEKNLKRTNKDQSGSLNICSTSKSCDEINFSWKDTSSKGTTSYEGSAFRKSAESQGIQYKYSSDASKFEQSFDVIFNVKKNNLVGYKIFHKDSEYGIELHTPNRAATAILETKTRGRAPKQTTENTLSIWLDKYGYPKNKLVITNTYEPSKIGDMEGHSTSTIIKHPSLPRDLELKLDYLLGFGNNLFYMKADFDAFDTKHQRWIFESRIKKQLVGRNGNNVIIENELRSKGTDVAAKLTLNGGLMEGSIIAGANLVLQDKGRVDKELTFNFTTDVYSAKMNFGSPLKSIGLEGKWSASHVLGYPRIQLLGSSSIFGLSPTKCTVDLDASPRVDIRIFNRAVPESYYQVIGGLDSDQYFEVGLIRQLKTKKLNIVAGSLALKTPYLLQSTLNWNEEELIRLLDVIKARSQLVREEVVTTMSTLTKDLQTILPKWQAFGSITTDFQKLAADYAQQMNKLKDDTNKDLSLRNVIQLMKVVEAIIIEFGVGVEELADIIEQSTLAAAQQTQQQAGKVYGSLSESMSQAAAATSEAFRDIFQGALFAISDLVKEPIQQLQRWLADFSKTGGGFAAQGLWVQLYETTSKIGSGISEQYRKLLSWYNSYNFQESTFAQSYKQVLSIISQQSLRQRILNFLEDTVLLPYTEYLDAVSEAYPETKRLVYRYGHVPVNYVRGYINQEKSGTTQLSTQPKSLMSSLIGEVAVFNVKKGEIIYMLPLHRRLSSLKQLPKLVNVGGLKDILMSVTYYSSLKDMYYNLRALWSPSFIASRNRGYAVLIGSGGYITFDKKSYEMNSNCQYLLSRDFLDGDFTVVVNYEESPGDYVKKSIIFADQTDQVEISGKQVLVNNKPITAAPPLKSIVVKREGSIVTVQRSHGVVLQCDVEHDICRFDISPFYVGRTMGLWGTFNNEAADDMKTPTGKVEHDVMSFATSWKLNKSCKEKIHVASDIAKFQQTSSAVASKCKELFQDADSSLRPCFGVVSAKPYYEICVKAASKVRRQESQKAAVISAGRAYASACERFHVPITLPAVIDN